jgi:hypothetical protein
MLEKWTKTSFSPLVGVMKPKPRSLLKNFTVPVSMFSFSFCFLFVAGFSLLLGYRSMALRGGPGPLSRSELFVGCAAG